MLAKVSKRINEILQTQDHPDILTSPKNRKGTNEEHFLKTYAGSIEAIDRVNFSERKERPSHSNKQPLPPKSSNNLAYNSAAKSDKEPDNRSRRSIDRTMSVQQQPESALSAQMFVSLYKEEILAFIRPLLADLEEKVLRRIESVEKALRSVSDLQKFSPVLMAPTPNFSTPNKAPLTIQPPSNSEIQSILGKAQLISSKIEQNHLKVVTRLRELEEHLQRVSRKAAEKCPCLNHLENLVQGQNYLCEEVKQLKLHQHRRTPSN